MDNVVLLPLRWTSPASQTLLQLRVQNTAISVERKVAKSGIRSSSFLSFFFLYVLQLCSEVKVDGQLDSMHTRRQKKMGEEIELWMDNNTPRVVAEICGERR